MIVSEAGFMCDGAVNIGAGVKQHLHLLIRDIHFDGFLIFTPIAAKRLWHCDKYYSGVKRNVS